MSHLCDGLKEVGGPATLLVIVRKGGAASGVYVLSFVTGLVAGRFP